MESPRFLILEYPTPFVFTRDMFWKIVSFFPTSQGFEIEMVGQENAV